MGARSIENTRGLIWIVSRQWTFWGRDLEGGVENKKEILNNSEKFDPIIVFNQVKRMKRFWTDVLWDIFVGADRWVCSKNIWILTEQTHPFVFINFRFFTYMEKYIINITAWYLIKFKQNINFYVELFIVHLFYLWIKFG